MGVSDTAEADNNIVLDGTEYAVSFMVSFMGVPDAVEADNNLVLDGMEYAVSFMGVPDTAEAEEALTCGQGRKDTEDTESLMGG
eukprot:15334429-Ditylum_brightwellii.AAC.1